MKTTSFFRITLLLALAASILLAQSDLGTISGFIKDPTGATIPNVTVTVRNQSGLERQVTTNESGFYTVTNIPPGLYTLSVAAPGFKRFETTNNKLDPSSNLSLDASLTVGSANETVEVVGTTQQLQTESGFGAESYHAGAD